MAEVKQYVNLNMQKQQLVAPRIDNQASAPGSPVSGQIYYNTVDNTIYMWNGTSWIDLGSTVTGPVLFKGALALPANFPAATEGGDLYYISTSGTIGGTGPSLRVGDVIISTAANAGGSYASVGSSWDILEGFLNSATDSTPGTIQIATQSEVNTGTDYTKAVTPLTLATNLGTKKYSTTTSSLSANTPVTITHNLGTQDVSVANYLIDSPSAGQRELVTLRVLSTTANAITIESNLAIGSPGIRTVITTL